MNILKLLKNKLSINETGEQSKIKDERKAECPGCHNKLKKIPGAKTKCPHCKKFMFVRTKPNNIRLIVTEKEAEEIDEMWRIENGTQEAFLAEKKRFDDKKELLQRKFGGKKPSDIDVQWGLLGDEITENASNHQWGLYRNTRFQMAEILRKEKRLKEALQMYLVVCYLDLNGATNMPTNGNGKVIYDKEYSKPFDLEFKFLAPGVIDRIQKIVKKMKLSKKEVERIYTERTNEEYNSIKSPRAPVDCFDEIKSKIWK